MILKNKYLLIVLSSILLGLSQQPLSLGFMAWFGLIPFILVIDRAKSNYEIIKVSFLWGFLYHVVVVFWLASNIGTSKFIAFISMVAAVLILSTNTIIISLLWFKIKNQIKKYRLYLIPFVWVSIEYIRSYGVLGFPWVSLANSQLNFLYLIQNVEYTGIYGISFWIILINVVLYEILFEKSSKNKIYVLIIIFIFPWISGLVLYQKQNQYIMQQESGLSFLSVQPNINLIQKRDAFRKDQTLKNIIDNTKKELDNNIDLIIWPESAMPFYRTQNFKDRKKISNILFTNSNQKLLTGDVYYENEKIYNSSVLFDNKEIKNVYHKRQLVPMAEYVPLSENFDFLKDINLGQANFSKGDKDVIFNINEYSFASLICFESTFPDINRRHALKGIDVMIYLVNDGWYTSPPEPQQHARQAVFRAIENRIPIIRCANTGISMFINSNGEIIDQIILNKYGTIKGEINKNNNGKTFYTRFGNVFALILLLITISFLLKSIFLNEKK